MSLNMQECILSLDALGPLNHQGWYPSSCHRVLAKDLIVDAPTKDSKNPKKNKGAKPKDSKSSKGKAHKGKGAAPPKAKVSRKGRAVEASAPAPAESGSPAKKSRKKARKA